MGGRVIAAAIRRRFGPESRRATWHLDSLPIESFFQTATLLSMEVFYAFDTIGAGRLDVYWG